MEIFTDGTGGPKKITEERPPRSGWAFVVMEDSQVVYEACAPIRPQVTTNAAELEAMIRAINYVHHRPPEAEPVQIWTDSKYVADTVSNITAFADNDFEHKPGKAISNDQRIRFLYDLLYPLGEHRNVFVRWVKGHSSVPGNERADKLAAAAAYKGQEYAGPPTKK